MRVLTTFRFLDDDSGVKTLLNQTLDLIADERVRIFCVAAQVMDVEQKIDSAITECMRLGAHAIRTAMVYHFPSCSSITTRKLDADRVKLGPAPILRHDWHPDCLTNHL